MENLISNQSSSFLWQKNNKNKQANNQNDEILITTPQMP